MTTRLDLPVAEIACLVVQAPLATAALLLALPDRSIRQAQLIARQARLVPVHPPTTTNKEPFR